jgi:hypothetical protein
MTSALSVVLSVALGAAISQSRFGIVARDNGTDVGTVVAACPRAVEAAPLVSGSGEPILLSYRQQCTGGVEMLALPSVTLAPVQLTLAQGQTDAVQYFGLVQSLAFSGVTTTTLRWVVGPPNLFQVVNPNALGFAEYVKGFVSGLAQQVKQRATTDGATYALVLPPWSTTNQGAFCDVVAAGRAIDARIAWSWGATTNLPANVADEATTTFGYRTVRTACALEGMPLFVDLTAAGGWFGGGRTATQVVDWMTRMDQAVAGDADVVSGGALLLHAVGGGGLDDLGPAAPQLATFLRTPPGGGGGTTGPSNGGSPIGSPGGGTGTPLTSGGGHTGCGNAGGAASLLALAPLAIRLRRRR